MLENFFKRFKQDNGVPQAVETSPYANVEGLEGKIKVPEPTKDDRRWANKIKNATSDSIGKALGAAIEQGKNWRVWFLLNRPLKATTTFLRGIKETGFGGKKSVAEGIEKAAECNNVTAAYLLLKYAEKNQDSIAEGAKETVREEVSQAAATGLQNTAAKPGSDVFRLLAQTFSTLLDKDMHPGASEQLVDYQNAMKQAAIKAAGQGHEDHLDAMLANRLLTPQQFVEAYMGSFFYTKLFEEKKDVTPKEREAFLGWLVTRGIVDQTFADEAANVEVRMGDAKATFDAAAAKGWKMSTRDLPLADGTVAKADASQVEITTMDAKEGAITYVFNYNAARAHKIRGALVQELAADQLPALMQEGKQFLDSSLTEAPELEWKKGEPFRLRFKQAPVTP